jgi:hypothetical protein
MLVARDLLPYGLLFSAVVAYVYDATLGMSHDA